MIVFKKNATSTDGRIQCGDDHIAAILPLAFGPGITQARRLICLVKFANRPGVASGSQIKAGSTGSVLGIRVCGSLPLSAGKSTELHFHRSVTGGVRPPRDGAGRGIAQTDPCAPDRLELPGAHDRAFGLRLIYLGNRAVLPAALAAEAERALTDRLMGDVSGGLTLTAALAETDRLLPSVGEGRDRELLDDYRVWLVTGLGGHGFPGEAVCCPDADVYAGLTPKGCQRSVTMGFVIVRLHLTLSSNATSVKCQRMLTRWPR